MASTVQLRQISRDKLFATFKSWELVKLFEDLLYAVDNTLPGAADAVQANLTAHISDTGDAHQASAIGATPGGTRPSNTVQGQLGNLDTAKLNASLVTAFALTLLDDANAAAMRTTLGLGSMATQAAGSVAITGGTISGATFSGDVTGNVVLASGALGYAAGNGGTVTQLLNKTNPVTLNERCGEITTDGSGILSGGTVSFTFTNSTIAATDLLLMQHVSGGTVGNYQIDPVCATGSATIHITNRSGGLLTDALVLRFAVIKAATT